MNKNVTFYNPILIVLFSLLILKLTSGLLTIIEVK